MPPDVAVVVSGSRGGVQQEKSQILGQALELDATQAAAFWPVYKKYEAELAAIGDARYAGIKDYAAHYGSLTDAKATELMNGAIGLEEKRLALIKRYAGEFKAVLPAVNACGTSEFSRYSTPTRFVCLISGWHSTERGR